MQAALSVSSRRARADQRRTSRRNRLAGLLADVRGLATVEYVVLLSCIAVAGLVTWRFMGEVVVKIIGVE